MSDLLREALEEIATADPFHHKGSFYAYATARAKKALSETLQTAQQSRLGDPNE